MTATGRRRTVVLAPDSFKGSLDAAAAAAALADGWRSVRADDDVRCVPMADGGEGTLAAVRDATAGSREMPCTVTGPDDRPVTTSWLLLPDGTAVVELATAAGLPLLDRLRPLTAHTAGLGELLTAATRHPGVTRLVVGLGGSASTDGGTGALRALGARFRSADGRELPPGGAALRELDRIDTDELLAPPPGGVTVLSDVTAPLLGDDGAAAVFGPQKGAGPDDVAVLEAGLARFAAVLGRAGDFPGAGAAGGTGYGLVACWQGVLGPGAPEVARIVDLAGASAGADLVVTGEGRFDGQSLTGKVVGHVLERTTGPVALVAGAVDRAALAGVPGELAAALSLTELAGSAAAAMAEPQRWLRVAGAELARAGTASG